MLLSKANTTINGARYLKMFQSLFFWMLLSKVIVWVLLFGVLYVSILIFLDASL